MIKLAPDAKPFFGYTNGDGTRVSDAHKSWPFGSVGPVSEYSFRYAPDSAVYEKQPKVKKPKVEKEPIDPGVSVFGSMTSILTTSNIKVSK